MDIYSSTEYFNRKNGAKLNAQVLVVNFKKMLTSNPSLSPELQVSIRISANIPGQEVYNTIYAYVSMHKVVFTGVTMVTVAITPRFTPRSGRLV